MSTTEIIPSNPLPLPGFEGALIKMDALEAKLEPLAERARNLAVTDADSFAEAGAIIAELKDIKAESEIEVAPFKLIVTRVKDFIQTRFNRNANRATEIHSWLTPKMAAYSKQEKKETAVEQKQLDKKGIDGTVRPNIPKVAGVRATVNYPITIEDKKLLIRAFAKAYKASDTKRVQFLSRFITLDAQELRAYAKELKKPEQFNKELPGVKCKEEEAFGGKV